MRKLSIVAIALTLGSQGVWYFVSNGRANANNRFEFAEVQRGDMENLVSSTGTLVKEL